MADPSVAEAVGLPPKEAIAFLRQKVNVPTERWTDLWNEAHSRAFGVAGAATEALVADFRTAVAKAIEQGTTLAEFRRDFDSIVAKHGWVHNGSAGWRSQIIYETNLSTAYSAGRYAQMTEPDVLEAFPYWRYQHNAAIHPRIQHLEWSGLVLRADDPWWSTHYPPNGWRCHCSVSAVSEGGLRRMGRTAPDKAPPVDLQKVRLKTGADSFREVEVPRGIDPGFGYNPGQAWLEHADRPVVGQLPPRPPSAPKPEPKPPAPVHVPQPADAGPVTVQEAVPPITHPIPPPPPAPPAEPAAAKPVVPKARSLAEADRALTEAFTPWAAALSAEEASVLTDYKGTGFKVMNEVLRGELDLPTVRKRARALARAIRRARMPFATRVFRGIGNAELHAVFDGKVAGDEVSKPDFVSASLSEAKADEFSHGTMLEIVLRRGTRAAYVHPFPRPQSREYEVLMAPETRLKIIARTEHRIVLEAVSGSAPAKR